MTPEVAGGFDVSDAAIAAGEAEYLGKNGAVQEPDKDARGHIVESWSIKDLMKYDVANDANAVIGFHEGRATRYLCRGYGAWLIGPSGIGKSSLAQQTAYLWALQKPFCNISAVKPLRVLIVQSENDQGDCAEATQGILNSANFTAEEFDLLNERVKIIRCRGKTGLEFCRWLEREIAEFKADLVLIDPLLRFAGIDVSRQDQCTKFLNDCLDPVLAATGVVMIGMHHTGKLKNKKETMGQTIYEKMYSGIGSSELVNWARAVIIIDPKDDGLFEMLLAKRGQRAWATHPEGDFPTTSIFLRHAADRILWIQVPPPELPQKSDRKGAPAGRPNKIVEVATMNLHSFCAACTTEGEGLNIIAARLETWLAKERKDVGITTCKKVVAALVANGKLSKNANALYLKGPEA